MKEQRIAQISFIGFSLILFALSVWAIAQETAKYDIHQIWASVREISSFKLFVAVGLTMINYVMLTGYDTLAVRYIAHPLPYRKTALAAIISHAISNSIGFALLSGSAIRYRFYRSWGLSVTKIAQIIAFCNLSFWLGLLAVGGLLFIIEPLTIPRFLHLPFNSVHPIGIIFLILVISYLLVTVVRKTPLKIGKWKLPHLPLQICLSQIAVTSLDWSLAASVLYLVLPPHFHLSYPSFFGIYLLGQIAGIISNVPGGLGIFESVILLSLSHSIPTDQILVSLLAYREIYYFLPLLTSVFFLGLYELRQMIINN